MPIYNEQLMRLVEASLIKEAILDTALLGTLIGSGIGAYKAPPGHRFESAMRSAPVGFMTGAGAGGGLGLGGLAGLLGGHSISPELGLPGAAIGASLGGLGLGYGSYRLGKRMINNALPTPSWEQDRPSKKEHEATKEHKSDKKK